MTNNFLLHHFPGQGVLSYIGYIGMRSPEGYSFSAVLVINRASILFMKRDSFCTCPEMGLLFFYFYKKLLFYHCQ